MSDWFTIKREGYTLHLSYPEVYVDNRARGRSGHMSHALAEFAPDTLINFNSNCSPVRLGGHAAYGWIEYRVSKDAGVTYGPVKEYPFSKEAFLDGNFTVSVEKAVATSSGRIVISILRNDPLHPVCCEPWFTPMAAWSDDGGESWAEPVELSPFRGRVYDMLVWDDVIYALEFCNDAEVTFTGNKDEHLYRIFESRDGGESWDELCVVPLDSTQGRGYGSMLFDQAGNLHVYAYNVNAEREMDHLVSPDLGKTWTHKGISHVEKGIRNPQTNIIDGIFVLHGRGEKSKGFVFYSSTDGYVWDEGTYLEREKSSCYYSCNVVLRDPAGGNRLLVQYSDTYEGAKVNAMHMWVKVEKE